jgi:hypothetical protein
VIAGMLTKNGSMEEGQLTIFITDVKRKPEK